MKQIAKFRPIVTLITSAGIISLLAWNYFNGGVPSHNILAKADMPSISNWWGALLIPLLTWFLLGRTQKRITVQKEFNQIPKNVYWGFLGGFIYGLLLAVSFTYDVKWITDNMIYVILGTALFYPIYRAECILGFILAMTYTFGAVLPTGFALVIAGLGAIIYLSISYLKKLYKANK